MNNIELLNSLGKKVSCKVSEDVHVGENKKITMKSDLSGELTAVVFTTGSVGIAIDDSDIFCFHNIESFKVY